MKRIRDLLLGKSARNDKASSSLANSYKDNINLLKSMFVNDDTVIFRQLKAGKDNGISCCLVYIDEMVDKEIVNENIIKPIMQMTDPITGTVLDYLQQNTVVASSVKSTEDIETIIEGMLYGDAILLVDGSKEAIIVDAKGWKTRSIESPQTEAVVRGPREGFTESLIVNLTLIRRRVLTSDLKFEFMQIGARSKTKICVCYLDSLVDKKILKEVKDRLKKVNIDGILDSGYIQEIIKDSQYTPFKTIGSTERPDTTVGRMLEGRIAVVCDGTPFVLTMPYLFIENFQANEDYYNDFFFASINRILRYLSFFLTISVPAVYLSLTTYHQEMIPTPLLLSISASREGVPFPTVVEVFLMLVVFEILREAGIRLPTPIGQTVSIVGALVLGEAAITAKIISAPMVIIVALTGITSYLMTEIMGALIITRIILLSLSALLGLYGYIFGLILIALHLLSLTSFGIPYMQNTASLNLDELKDTAVRSPWKIMYKRGPENFNKDKMRQKPYNPLKEGN